jgi:hypothetical protein
MAARSRGVWRQGENREIKRRLEERRRPAGPALEFPQEQQVWEEVRAPWAALCRRAPQRGRSGRRRGFDGDEIERGSASGREEIEVALRRGRTCRRRKMGERWRRPKFDRYEVRGLARDGGILGPLDH